MKNLPKVTPEEILSWQPCESYDLKKIKKLFGRKKKANALDILNCEEISIEDRFWVVLREEMLSERILRLFAISCAEHVLPIFEKKYPEDRRPRTAIDAAKKYLMGEITKEELDAAGAVAGAAERKWQLKTLTSIIIQDN